jgi:hypothetical protein
MFGFLYDSKKHDRIERKGWWSISMSFKVLKEAILVSGVFRNLKIVGLRKALLSKNGLKRALSLRRYLFLHYAHICLAGGVGVSFKIEKRRSRCPVFSFR